MPAIMLRASHNNNHSPRVWGAYYARGTRESLLQMTNSFHSLGANYGPSTMTIVLRFKGAFMKHPWCARQRAKKGLC